MATQVTVRIVNGFVTPGRAGTPAHGGNPAGVVLDADDLSEADMQSVAAAVGHSETAFVSASETADFRFDFFTPTRRIAHCGHATIAAFGFLAETGRLSEGDYSKETVDGPRKVIIEGAAAYMEQLAPRYETSSDWADSNVSDERILRSLGLDESHMMEGLRPTLVNTGNSFMVIGVESSSVLSRLAPNFAAIEEISEALDLIGYYVFATDSEAADVTTRMFAPRYGIFEEAATGMAAGPLACLLHDGLGVSKTSMKIVQGAFMDPISQSEINVRLRIEKNQIGGLMAGGLAQVIRDIRVTLDTQ